MDGEDYANSFAVNSTQTSREQKYRESKDGVGADASKQADSCLFVCLFVCLKGDVQM
jgi:hypothetical protein